MEFLGFEGFIISPYSPFGRTPKSVLKSTATRTLGELKSVRLIIKFYENCDSN